MIVAATLTGALFLSGLGEIVAVFIAKGAANLPVLPEVTLAAACRPVLMVADPVDQNCVVHLISSISDRFHRIIPEQKTQRLIRCSDQSLCYVNKEDIAHNGQRMNLQV